MVVMARNDTDKILAAIADRDRYFGTILEDLQEKFSLLLEGYTALNARMDALDAKIDRVAVDLNEKIEIFRGEANAKFAALFDGQQEFFEEMQQFHLRLAALEGKS
jgi:hypothetical protein